MKYKPGVDFVIVAYGKFDYVRLCVASIEKYWQGIDYTIYVIVNYTNENEIEIVNNLFKDSNNVIVLKGVDQSRTTVVSETGAITQQIGTNAPGYPKNISIGKVDGCRIGAGSWYGAWATNIGIDQGDRQYVCVLS